MWSVPLCFRKLYTDGTNIIKMKRDIERIFPVGRVTCAVIVGALGVAFCMKYQLSGNITFRPDYLSGGMSVPV